MAIHVSWLRSLQKSAKERSVACDAPAYTSTAASDTLDMNRVRGLKKTEQDYFTRVLHDGKVLGSHLVVTARA